MNRRSFTNRGRARTGGFSLIEVVIAVAIVGVSFLAIIATLGVGTTNNQTSTQQTAATNIAASILADLRSTPGNVPTSSTPPTYTPAATSTRFSIQLPGTITAAPPLKAATVQVMYFDNSGAFIAPANPGAAPANALYVAHVYPAMLSYVGLGPSGTSTSQYTYLVRINVAWPAQAAVPVGNTDVITQYISH